jgi:hypothetical protein
MRITHINANNFAHWHLPENRSGFETRSAETLCTLEADSDRCAHPCIVGRNPIVFVSVIARSTNKIA